MSRKREAQLLAKWSDQEKYVAEQMAKWRAWRATTSQTVTAEIEKEVERRIRAALAAKNKGK